MNPELIIRPISFDDAEKVCHWENTVDGWSENLDGVPYTVANIVGLIRDLQDLQECKQARWIIEVEKKSIGVVDLADIDFEEKTASVGVMIASKEERRKGFASKALLLLEKQAVQVGVEILISNIRPYNLGSIALFENLGYKRIGTSMNDYLNDGNFIDALNYRKCLKK